MPAHAVYWTEEHMALFLNSPDSSQGKIDVLELAETGKLPLILNLGQIIRLYVEGMPTQQAEPLASQFFHKIRHYCARERLKPVVDKGVQTVFTVTSPVNAPLLDYAHRSISWSTLFHRDQFTQFLNEMGITIPDDNRLARWWVSGSEKTPRLIVTSIRRRLESGRVLSAKQVETLDGCGIR